jgi:hypothetical protein
MERIMTNRIRLILALALLCAASTAVHASDNAYLYLVQGIPGRDYSTTTDPEFPVDVLINDEVCNVHGLSYGAIFGPLTFVPGTYDIKSSGTPALETFTTNCSPVSANNARIQFALAADSPAVQLILQNTSTKKLYTYSVNPKSLLNVTLPAGIYTAEVNEGTITLVSSTVIALRSQSVTLMYATGEAANNTVDLETKAVRDVL